MDALVGDGSKEWEPGVSEGDCCSGKGRVMGRVKGTYVMRVH